MLNICDEYLTSAHHRAKLAHITPVGHYLREYVSINWLALLISSLNLKWQSPILTDSVLSAYFTFICHHLSWHAGTTLIHSVSKQLTYMMQYVSTCDPTVQLFVNWTLLRFQTFSFPHVLYPVTWLHCVPSAVFSPSFDTFISFR